MPLYCSAGEDVTDLTAVTGDVSMHGLPKVAFYHPWPPLDGRPISSWLKSMLLFFDGVAVLVARNDRWILIRGQEETVYPLQEAGLLHILDPDDVIDHDIANALTEFVLEIATSDERELLRDPDSGQSQALLRNRWIRPRKLTRQERAASEMVWEEMKRRGYVSRIRRDSSIYLSSHAWAAILAFLAQALRPAGRSLGLDLLPATDNPSLVSGFRDLLDHARRDPAISMADVVAFDLEQVALDLSGVPITDLLEFRQQHGGEYQRYVSNARTFAQQVASTPKTDRAAVLRDRRNELAAEADQLVHIARTWWRQPVASVSVGLAGAVLAGAHGDWSAAALSLLSGIVGSAGRPDTTSAYSYLFRTGSRFGT
jgi:hypothetical protein